MCSCYSPNAKLTVMPLLLLLLLCRFLTARGLCALQWSRARRWCPCTTLATASCSGATGSKLTACAAGLGTPSLWLAARVQDAAMGEDAGLDLDSSAHVCAMHTSSALACRDWFLLLQSWCAVSCSWVAPGWLEFVSRRLRVAVGYPMGRWRTLMPCK
jgi:hypothetical protein